MYSVYCLTESKNSPSASTVAILPVAEAVDVEINNGDLALIPIAPAVQVDSTSIQLILRFVLRTYPQDFCDCQDEKSQHKNKAKAMKVLTSRLFAGPRRSSTQRNVCYKKSTGRVWRSIRANRTYNYPQNRITDHRINLTLYKLDRFMEGDVLDMIDALNANLQEQQIAELGTEFLVFG